MFKSLHVKNFQSWEDVELQFDPGVNVLCGLSTSGKTALLLRSIGLLVENRPLGAKFYSDFADKKGETVVELVTSENDKLKLVKKIHVSKVGEKVIDKTEYSLNGNEPFSGMGDKVPDQILEKLNLSELNRQKQFDQPFLVMSSPGEIGRLINRITKLEAVDTWIGELRSDIDSNNKQIRFLESNIQEIETTLQKYEDVDETEKIINSLLMISQKFEEVEEEIFDLEKLIRDCKSSKQKHAFLKERATAEKYILRASKIEDELSNLACFERQVFEMGLLSSKIKQLNLERKDREDLMDAMILMDQTWDFSNEEIKNLEIFINGSKKISFVKKKLIIFERLFSNLNEAQNKYNDEAEEYFALKTNFQDYAKVEKSMALKETELENLKIDYINELREFGKCPVCFQKMDSKHLHRIKEEL